LLGQIVDNSPVLTASITSEDNAFLHHWGASSNNGFVDPVSGEATALLDLAQIANVCEGPLRKLQDMEEMQLAGLDGMAEE
jgi:hypothetical protein